jgi:predicted transcriptional regulator of viral defense system
MKYLEFKESFKNKTVFTHNDIRKVAPAFHRRQLVEWQIAGHIVKIRNGYYCFSDQEKNEQLLYHFANQLYKPSYISLVSAMSYYNLIPEAVFNITSVGTLKTTLFDTPYGRFEYRNLKPSLFFGYKLVTSNNFTIKIAEPEKMILDYCYLVKPTSQQDFESLRINKEEIIKLIDITKLDAYLSLFKSPIMNHRAGIFKTYINA